MLHRSAAQIKEHTPQPELHKNTTKTGTRDCMVTRMSVEQAEDSNNNNNNKDIPAGYFRQRQKNPLIWLMLKIYEVRSLCLKVLKQRLSLQEETSRKFFFFFTQS